MAMNNYGLGITFTAKDNASKIIRRMGQSMDLLARQSKRMSRDFRRVSRGIKLLSRNARMASSAFKGMKSGVSSASKVSSSMTNKISGTATSVDKLSNSSKKASNNVGKLNRSMNKSVSSADKMNDSIKQAFYTMSSGQMVFNRGVRTMKAFGSTVTQFADFEHALAGVGAKMGATGKELAILEKAAIQAGVATQFSPTQAVEGLSELASKGLNATDAIKTLLPALDLAAAGQLSVGEATNAVIGTIKAYGMELGNAGIVTDKLLKITSITGMQSKDFEAGLSKAAAAGSVYGQSLDETLVSLGLMRNMNIDATVATTAYRSALQKIATDKGAQKSIRKYTDIYDKMTGKMRPVLTILSDLKTATAHLSKEEQTKIAVSAVGARGLFMFAAASKASAKQMKNGTMRTLEGAEAIGHLREQIGTAEGTSKKFINTLQDTMKGQAKLISGTLQTIAIMLGKSLGTYLKPVLKVIYKGLSSFVIVLRDMNPKIKAVVASIGIMVGAFIALAGAVMVYQGVISLVGPMSVKALMMMRGAMTKLMVSAPYILALAAAFFVLYKAYSENWGGFRDGVNSFLGGFKDGLMIVWKGIKGVGGAIAWMGGLVVSLIDNLSSMWSVASETPGGKSISWLKDAGKYVGILVGGLFALKLAMIAFKAGMIIFKAGAIIYSVGAGIMTVASTALSFAFWSILVPLLPIIATVALVAGAFYLLYRAFTDFDGLMSDLKTAFYAVGRAIKWVWDGVIGAISKSIAWIGRQIQKIVDKALWAKRQVAKLNPANAIGGVGRVLKERMEEAKAKNDAKLAGGEGTTETAMPAKATNNNKTTVIVQETKQAPPNINVNVELDGEKMDKNMSARYKAYQAQIGKPVSVISG